MNGHLTINDVQQALQLPDFDVLTAHQLMIPLARTNERPASLPGRARIGGVLLLLYTYLEQLHIVLTRRREDLRSHAGQISFPGGRSEPDETLQQTALRETHEEIGIAPTAVSILGELTSIYIPPSDYEVHPFVGWLNGKQRPVFHPAEQEVAEIIEAPLTHLLKPETRKEGPWEFRGHQITVPYFDVDGHMVWGATAIMLSEFIERLRIILETK